MKPAERIFRKTERAAALHEEGTPPENGRHYGGNRRSATTARRVVTDFGPIVVAEGLCKSFGDQEALRNIDLKVDPGTIVGLIGPSGCGKTTLVKVLTGILRPTSGNVRVFGREPLRFTTRERVRFGYMPQLPVLFPNLTVWGNLSFVASVYGVPLRHRRRRLLRLLDLVDLAEHRKKRFVDLSGGMQRRLSLAATLVHDPDLVYLDEPTAGVDPILRERFWSHFRDLRDAGRTIVVPTQYVGEAVSCDLVVIMSGGRVVAIEPPERLCDLAYGGVPLRVDLRHGWLSGPDLGRLRSEPFSRSVSVGEDRLIVAVDEAQTGIDKVHRFFDTVGADVGSVEPFEPTLDEIFMRIIEDDEHSQLMQARA